MKSTSVDGTAPRIAVLLSVMQQQPPIGQNVIAFAWIGQMMIVTEEVASQATHTATAANFTGLTPI